MTRTSTALFHLRRTDELASSDSPIHRIHPAAKLLVTLFYLAGVVSFGKYDLTGVLFMAVYPIFILMLSGIPLKYFLTRLLILEPLIIGVGLLNPLFQQMPAVLFGFQTTLGWITFFSILAKGTLTVAAGLLLAATTGIDRICAGFGMLRLPRILILQILLTYRYALVLVEEVALMSRAYELRAPGSRGVAMGSWGSFAGQLLLRTYDRAIRVYQSMVLRGYTGEYRPGTLGPLRLHDGLYILAWAAFFVICLSFPLPELLGALLKGGLGL